LNRYAKFVGRRSAIKSFSDITIPIRSLIRGLSPLQLKKRLGPDKWSIQQIIQHLAETEMVNCCRSRWIAFEDKPSLIAFDQNKWADGREREKESISETLERFRLVRRSHMRFFRSASKKDLKRSGLHTERGVVTLKTHLETIVGHDLNHLEQIRELASKLKSRKDTRRHLELAASARMQSNRRIPSRIKH